MPMSAERELEFAKIRVDMPLKREFLALRENSMPFGNFCRDAIKKAVEEMRFAKIQKLNGDKRK